MTKKPMLQALFVTFRMHNLLPSQLPTQAIDEFQTLWKKHYGTELSREEATTRAHQLLALLQIITETIPETKSSSE